MKKPPRELPEHREASKWMYDKIEWWGFDIEGLSAFRARAIIARLELREPWEQIACDNSVREWKLVPPTKNQQSVLDRCGLSGIARTKREASLVLDAKLDPVNFMLDRLAEVRKAKSSQQLDAVGADLRLVKDVLGEQYVQQIVYYGREKREELGNDGGLLCQKTNG